ncbi:MAG: periplasmic heavy metal sensor [Thermoanaerobaculia bacterium]|nr:periplasmic heavy metal sensor [Thermoanaerobaculia bacterium]
MSFPRRRGPLAATLTFLAAAALPLELQAHPPATPPQAPPLAVAFRDYVEDLDLSSAQRDAIRAVFRAHSTRLFIILQQEAQTRTALQTAIHQVPSNPATLSRASAAVASADQALALERARIYAELSPILTPDQRERTEEFLDTARALIETRLFASRDRLQEAIETGTPLPLLSRLDLSPSQKEALKALYTQYQPVVSGLLAEERTARAGLVAAIRKPSVDADAVTRASAAVAVVDAQLAQERARIWTGVSNILTAEQRGQVEEARERVQRFVRAAVRGFVTFFFDLMS